MVKIHNSLSELKYMQLMEVYSEDFSTGVKSGDWESISAAEQDYYEYLRLFFKTKGAFVAIWEEEGQYCSAVRIEPWQDGYLLSGLTTAPGCRRKGYGSLLLRHVLAYLPTGSRVYSHIEKFNLASLALHSRCGFSKQKDYACMLDGSVLNNYYTYSYEN